MKEIIPYVGDEKTRRRIDQIFSRKMLGSVLVGKFMGDYTAILTTRYFGTDPGYIFGIIITIGLFVWWEELERKAKEAADTATGVAGEAAGD